MDRVVGIGECIVSNNPLDIIKTYALASCVAVTVYSFEKKVAGMVHIALPERMKTYDNSYEKPCYYATLAVPFLIHKICDNYECNIRELEIEIFGGACSKNKNDVFQIGMRNIIATEKALHNLNLKYKNIETGGNDSRTLELEVFSGSKKMIKQPLII